MDTQVKMKPKIEVIKEPIAHLLVPGEMGVVLELTVKDKDGKVTDHRVMRSKSLVKQFLQLLWVEMYGLPATAPLSIRDTGNTLQNVYQYILNFWSAGGIGDVTFGTIVGTGVTAPTIDDYKIETIIDHGVAAGQLQYGAVTFGAPSSDATTSQFTVTRNFANGSGGAITVNEIALYVTGKAGKYMTIHDVIGGGVAVPDGQTLTVNYRPQVVV